ncbi:hypothetical protein MNBD_UNCLBAC01-442 [hydrothermal vent metagenome]|uniref:Rrf2 family transcriptional regulator n=1 Tax=hydrothermal vent metagenome TaxID=652676 RepID=A0A3B1DR59_9ZZZZ
MFKVNRKIEYALISLKHMGGKIPGQLTSAKEICELYQTPFDPTARVLQIMAQKGILQAEQGAHGGYQIIKDLTKISLRELSDMLIGPIEITNCVQGEYDQCGISDTCQIIAPMLDLNHRINDFFTTIMLNDLIEAKTIKRNKSKASS